MADLGAPFDPNEIPEDERSFDPLPAGDYLMQVVESEIAQTKSGSGEMLNVTLEIVDGQFERRKIWERINISNTNPDAQRIGQRQLADLCLATGAGTIKDSEELHYKPFIGKVVIEKDKAGVYQDKNTVKRFRPPAGSAPSAKAAPEPAKTAAPSRPAATTAGATKAPPAPANSGGKKRPWDKTAGVTA